MFNVVHGGNCKHDFGSEASMLTENVCNISYTMRIGEVLKEARNTLGLSQGVVAAEIRKRLRHPFSREALSQIESGTTKNPRPAHLMACCEVLGIDMESAIKGKMKWRTAGSAENEIKVSSEEALLYYEENRAMKEVLELAGRLSTDQIERWVEFGKFLSGSPASYQERKMMRFKHSKHRDIGTISPKGDQDYGKKAEAGRTEAIRLLGANRSNKKET